MVRFTRIRSALLVAALTLASAVPALASSDELYYPASNCQPFNGAGWQGGGSSGFAFQPLTGGLHNFDVNQSEALVCPVPYFRDVSNLAPITVRIVVEDRHLNRLVVAYLCGRDSTGPKICDSADNFPTVFGTSTIELTIQPDASTRFVWIEVLVPDREDDGSRSDGASGLLGYRVLR